MKRFILFTYCFFSGIFAAFGQPAILDNTFGSGGIVTTDFGDGYAYCNALAIQTDGKIVVVGQDNNGFALVRYNVNGGLDSTFDFDGKVFTTIGTMGSTANSVDIQSDGKIVVAGFCWNGANWDFAVVRYNTNGGLDYTFDADGIVTTQLSPGSVDYGNSVKIQSDGKIVVAGTSNNKFALVRYNNDGSLDNNFDLDGRTITSVGPYDGGCTSMAIQIDGKIVLGGACKTGVNTAPSKNALIRYNTNGTLDTTFSNSGIITWSMGGGSSFVNAIAIQADGKIFAAGMSDAYIAGWDITLVRLNNDGTFDNTFSLDGMLTTNFGGNEGAHSIAIQNNGKIVLAGNVDNGGPFADFVLIRYNTDGSIDNSFDFDGNVTGSVSNNDDHAKSVIIQNDGKILLAGFSYIDTSYDFTLIRYNGESLTAINEIAESNSFEVFPNPSMGIFTVNLKGKNVEGRIYVYDVLGNCLWERYCQSDVGLKVDLNDKPKGVYFMEILSEGQKAVKKIVVE